MPLHMSTRGRYGVRLMVALALNYGNGTALLRDGRGGKASPRSTWARS
jgi:hypothetical protein